GPRGGEALGRRAAPASTPSPLAARGRPLAPRPARRDQRHPQEGPTMKRPNRNLTALLASLLLSVAAVAGAQTIDFWYAVGGAQGTALQEMITEFNATNEYGITVNGTFSGSYGDTAQKVMASLAANTLPAGGLVPAGPLWTCREGNYLLEEHMAGPEGLAEDYF